MNREINRRQFLRSIGVGLAAQACMVPSAYSLASSPAQNSTDTIDAVIAVMEQIIDWSIANQDRRGYFIALYYNMTLAIRQAILNEEFEDNEHMETFAVRFFERYYAAFEQYAEGELPSRAWLGAFETTRSGDYIILQYMVGGINAHINLDLGVVTARLAPGDKLPGLRSDYEKIDTIIAPTFLVMDRRLDKLSPVYAQLTAAYPGLAFWLVNFSIQVAREAAWRMAEEIAYLSPTDQLPIMARRDDKVVELGEIILREGPLIEAIWESESKDVGYNVGVLAYGV
jgi:hypothetical protein